MVVDLGRCHVKHSEVSTALIITEDYGFCIIIIIMSNKTCCVMESSHVLYSLALRPAPALVIDALAS